MKMCQQHWDQLKKAVEDRHMGHMIAANGRDAAARIKSGQPDDFEPLLSAFFSIADQAVYKLGREVMTAGTGCPICATIAVHVPVCKGGCTAERIATAWIEGAADEALDYADHHGLMAVTTDFD